MGKTGVGGTLLAEAKYINLSLHNLEHVSHGTDLVVLNRYQMYGGHALYFMTIITAVVLRKISLYM